MGYLVSVVIFIGVSSSRLMAHILIHAGLKRNHFRSNRPVSVRYCSSLAEIISVQEISPVFSQKFSLKSFKNLS